MAGAKANSTMLAGCRVLDFTQYLAGPTVTRLMAEMGADIIRRVAALNWATRRVCCRRSKRAQRLFRAAEPGQEEPVP